MPQSPEKTNNTNYQESYDPTTKKYDSTTEKYYPTTEKYNSTTTDLFLDQVIRISLFNSVF